MSANDEREYREYTEQELTNMACNIALNNLANRQHLENSPAEIERTFDAAMYWVRKVVDRGMQKKEDWASLASLAKQDQLTEKEVEEGLAEGEQRALPGSRRDENLRDTSARFSIMQAIEKFPPEYWEYHPVKDGSWSLYSEDKQAERTYPSTSRLPLFTIHHHRNVWYSLHVNGETIALSDSERDRLSGYASWVRAVLRSKPPLDESATQ